MDPLSATVLHRSLAEPVPLTIWPDGFRRIDFTPEYAEAVYGLLRRAYTDGTGSIPESFSEWWELVRTDSEFDPALCILAVDPEGVPAGFCLCWTSSFIKDLVVEAGARKRGLGTALILTALTELRARGNDDARLKVQLGNAPAERLYAALGFVEHQI